MLAPIGPTMDTTYALQIQLRDGSWRFEGPEYTSASDCHELAEVLYGGAFAGDDMHRVVKIERTLI